MTKTELIIAFIGLALLSLGHLPTTRRDQVTVFASSVLAFVIVIILVLVGSK